MRSELIKLITLFAMLICLPLQGLAAITMPACQMHNSKMEMQVDASHLESMPHCDHHDNNQPSKSTSCNKCSYCFLTVAQAIIPSNISIALIDDATVFTDLITEIPDLFPPSLFHPPRSALS